MAQPNRQTEGLSLKDSHKALEQRGFDESFKVGKAGQVDCLACGHASPARTFKVDSQKRVEGVSDPDDESLVVALHCPSCGARGTLTLAYGPRAGREEAQVLGDLPTPTRRKAA
jgi:hypothetical protein